MQKNPRVIQQPSETKKIKAAKGKKAPCLDCK